MRRVTITLLLLAIGLAIPVGLLVSRALDSAAFEMAVRHDALAQRAFDEMERALSRFLQREEHRTFADYAGNSRLSTLPAANEPFVVGYFQIAPDGSFQTPRALRPRRPPVSKERPAARHARVESAVRAAWQRTPSTEPAAEAVRVAASAAPPGSSSPQSLGAATPAVGEIVPGATVHVGAPLEDPDEAGVDALDEGSRSAYAVLRELNIGSSIRQGRKRRTEPRKVQSGPSFVFVAQLEVVQRGQQAAPLGGGVIEEAQLILDPMVGRLGEGKDLVLYRTVVADSQGYRQGLLLDRERLGKWLEEQVVSRSGLGRMAELWFVEPGQDPPVPTHAEASVYLHRFGEPFDSMSAVLALDPLPGGGSTKAIYALTAMLVVVGLAGLFAVWRMVAVVVHFAERRSNFVSSVTHELKTPLTAIRMYGEMLRDGVVQDDAKRNEYYGTITNESERLSRLIDNVLEFSRLEKGQRELNLQRGGIGPLVAESADRLKPHAEHEGFRLEVEIEPDLPSVRLDRDATVQVLFNLVDNAIKYANKATDRRIVLRCARRGDGVAVSVRDFGPGIGRRNATRIFEPFYRGENELTRTTKGTGIGLALVKELAERMGAAVAGDSPEGGGFRVTLDFPAAAA